MRKQEIHPRTVVVNKAQKHHSKKTRLEALAWLMERFPEAFDNRLKIRPLKIGIMEDILAFTEEAQASGVSRTKLREAVVLFTRRVDYLTCLKAREVRVDLQGNPIAEVTEDEAYRASMKIKKRVEKAARNARKNLAGKVASYYQTQQNKPPQTKQPTYYAEKPASSHTYHDNYELNDPYMDRERPYSVPAASPKAPVVVRHKGARTYDSDAVARLREKLGLGAKVEEKEEQ